MSQPIVLTNGQHEIKIYAVQNRGRSVFQLSYYEGGHRDRKTFGKLSVALVDANHIVRILQPIWATKSETADKLRSRLERVLDWARVSGYRSGENPAGELEHRRQIGGRDREAPAHRVGTGAEVEARSLLHRHSTRVTGSTITAA